MIDQNTKYEGGMSDEQFGNLLAHLGRMEKENPMPKMETPRGGPEGTDKAITLPSIALRFSHGLSKAVRHEGAGQTEMNLVTGKTVRGGQFAPSPTAAKTPAAKVAAAPATPLTPTQEKQVQTALTSGQAEIAKDGTKYALKVKPAGNTRFRAVGLFKTLREAKAAVLPALGVEGKGAKVTAYQDVGAKIGGARKDIASARTKFEDNPTEDGLTALEGEDPAAASRAVKKSVLWPISSVDDMKAKGADPDSIYVAHALHSLISPKPEIDTADGRAHYFAGVATLRAFVEGSASFEALSERLRGLSADYRTASHAAYDEYRKTRGMRASYDEPCTLYQAEIGVQVAALGSRFHKFMGGKDTKVKGRDVYPLSLFRDGMGSHVKPERKWQIVHDAFGGGGETSTETVAGPKAKSVDDLDIAAERERLKQWERTAPTTYERKGGKVATIRRPEEYLKAFGLRGVEFGTYMDDEASRLHVDRCAEAFQDLADVLGISSKELSMNGRLALAFGARGSGGASAHYEPHKVVINLTKLGGAGALAHEWTHFFDHTLQRVESGNANSMDYLSKAGITRGQELTDVQKAMVGVMEKIYHGGGHMKYLPTPKSTSGFASTVDMYLSRHGNDPQKALDAVFKTYSGTSLSKLKDMADYMAHKTGAKQIDLPTKGSEYHGRMLRAGEYWARPQEMFARCMEAYVQDALTSKKRMNNYLVRETKKDEDSPLPRGEQRKSINAAIGVLLQAVRDGGTLKKALGLAKAVETETRVPKGQKGGGQWAKGDNPSESVLAHMVKKAVGERPSRETHGNTGTNAFWIMPNGTVAAQNEYDVARGKGAINVHSHSSENWRSHTAMVKRTGAFNPMNSGDIHAYLGYHFKHDLGNTFALIMADGRMESLHIPVSLSPEKRMILSKLTEKKIAAQLHPKYSEHAAVREKLGAPPVKQGVENGQNVERELVRRFAKRYGLEYKTGMRWKAHERGIPKPIEPEWGGKPVAWKPDDGKDPLAKAVSPFDALQKGWVAFGGGSE